MQAATDQCGGAQATYPVTQTASATFITAREQVDRRREQVSSETSSVTCTATSRVPGDFASVSRRAQTRLIQDEFDTLSVPDLRLSPVPEVHSQRDRQECDRRHSVTHCRASTDAFPLKGGEIQAMSPQLGIRWRFAGSGVKRRIVVVKKYIIGPVGFTRVAFFVLVLLFTIFQRKWLDYFSFSLLVKKNKGFFCPIKMCHFTSCQRKCGTFALWHFQLCLDRSFQKQLPSCFWVYVSIFFKQQEQTNY